MLNIYQSRIIDAEFFPHTLSVAETKTLKLLREIIDVKYLHTPLFTRQVLPPESLFVFFFINWHSFIDLESVHESRAGVPITDWR